MDLFRIGVTNSPQRLQALVPSIVENATSVFHRVHRVLLVALHYGVFPQESVRHGTLLLDLALN